MNVEHYHRVDLYRKVVQAKLFIDKHYSECIDLQNIPMLRTSPSFISSGCFKRVTAKHHTTTSHRSL